VVTINLKNDAPFWKTFLHFCYKVSLEHSSGKPLENPLAKLHNYFETFFTYIPSTLRMKIPSVTVHCKCMPELYIKMCAVLFT